MKELKQVGHQTLFASVIGDVTSNWTQTVCCFYQDLEPSRIKSSNYKMFSERQWTAVRTWRRVLKLCLPSAPVMRESFENLRFKKNLSNFNLLDLCWREETWKDAGSLKLDSWTRFISREMKFASCYRATWYDQPSASSHTSSNQRCFFGKRYLIGESVMSAFITLRCVKLRIKEYTRNLSTQEN